MIVALLGNKELLKHAKTAFLCSREVPASVVLRCYDWAIDQREKGRCIISGFHSKIEKDVFHYLLAGKQPIIMVLARGMKEKNEPELKAAVDAGRLLIVTPFKDSVKRVTEETAEKRNRFMLELADEIVVGHVSKDGMLETLLIEIDKNKVVNHLMGRI